MATLVSPPPDDTSRAPIENALELTPLSDIDSDLFTNTRKLWHPPGARGIFGGAAIAQCLAAAQRTVPKDFAIHSMHCYFVLAGDPHIPVIYHVEHVREGRSYATRTVQARQRGQAIFTTTLSFMREGSSGTKTLEHSIPMADVPGPDEIGDDMSFPQRQQGPFESRVVAILNDDSPNPFEKKTRQWMKARGRISEQGGHEAHLEALAYMSDSFFIGTVARVHKLTRFRKPRTQTSTNKDEFRTEEKKSAPDDAKANINMMVSLDHSIYFHNPKGFRADDWMLTEMHTPWAGDGRGLVFQHIFASNGSLIATCVQEGVVRLEQVAQSKL